METKFRLGGAVALLLVLASVTVASATSFGDNGSADSGDRELVVLNLLGHKVSETHVDAPPTGYSQGDQFVFTNDLISEGTKVGQEGGACTVTLVEANGGSTIYCVGNHSLPGGQVTTRGLITYGPEEEFKQDPYSLAITGGTGKYRTAHGEARVKELSAEEFRLTLRIVL